MTTPASLPPGPSSLPLVGNLPAFLRDPLQFLGGLSRQYGDVASFKLGRHPAVLLSDAALVDRVIRDQRFERTDTTRRAVAAVAGGGLLTLEGPQHRRHRRLMSPALHKDRIRRYVEIMSEETYRTLDAWPNGEERDLVGMMRQLTLNIVARCLFNTGDLSEAHHVDAALRRLRGWLLPSTMLARVLPFRLPMLVGPPARHALALQAFVREIVSARRAAGRDDGGDLLTMLLEARDEDGSALSDEEICAETLTMLIAGHATTAHTLTWAWHLLSQHPALQSALREEVWRVAGERPIGDGDLAQLTLTDRVVRETLRLYPPVWFTDRICANDSELGGYRIPAHTTVVISNWLLHRDPRHFADPERFDPVRFLPERASAIASGTYLPFGAGPHICIGSGFALTEARLVLAAMAQRFTIQAVPRYPVRPRPGMTLGMRHPFAVVPTRTRPSAQVASANV